MRSRRRRFELGCRIAAFAVLGWLIGTSLMPASRRTVEKVSSHDIGARLPGWTRLPASVALHAELTVPPDAWIADWLGALRHAGHAVTWSGTPAALAIAAEALADPTGGVRVDVAAPAGALLTLRDAASTIDSERVAALGATMTTAVAVDSIIVESNRASFGVRVPPPAQLRPVLVVGQAGWEGKFIARALEERGWQVLVRFAVAPQVDVTGGAALPLDTSRIAALIAVDSTAASLGGAALERFVREGGGLVLVGTAGSSRAVSALTPGTLGPRARPAALPRDTIGLGGTGFYPVRTLAASAAALERRDGVIAIAARRFGAGRVVQVGYDDTWRWRMAGGPGSVAAHREWWSRVVGSIAYVPGDARTYHDRGADAPLAHLVARVGAARPAPSARGRSVDHRILMALIMILLSLEWGSRRLRGLA